MSKIFSPKLYFIAITILISGIGFFKNFFFASRLNYADLGLLAIFQSIIVLVSNFHFGLLTGGFRLTSYSSSHDINDINNQVYTIIFLLLLIMIPLCAFISQLQEGYIYIACFIGLVSLALNWSISVCLAQGFYNQINLANLIAAISSIFFLYLVEEKGILGAYIVLLSQPLIAIFTLLLVNRRLLPNRFFVSYLLLKKIMSSGFFPFIAGIIFILYLQIERLTIAHLLSSEELGKFTLLFIVTTIWILVPTSFFKIYFPQATKKYNDNNFPAYRLILKKHLYINLAYCIFSATTVIVLLEVVVANILPKHVMFIDLVFYALPGLIARTLSDTGAIVMQAQADRKGVVIGDSVSLLFYLVLLLVISLSESIQLESFIFASVAYFIFKLILFWKISYKLLKEAEIHAGLNVEKKKQNI